MDTDIRNLAVHRHLANPTEAQIDEITTVLQEAMKDDPSTSILHGKDPKLARLKFRSGVCAAAIGGVLHVLLVPSATTSPSTSSSLTAGAREGPYEERIIGVAIWYPPGTSSSLTSEQRKVGLETYFEGLEKTNPKLKAWWVEYLVPNYEKTYASVLPPGFAKDSWYLAAFGVLPAYQGKGLGKKLFKVAESQAQATKTPITLDTGTDLDIVIYRKFGLKVVGEMKVENEYGSQKMSIMIKQWE
ncbi:hypothetical protein BKA70DRAFT_202292 [Coprinopsis sp. MPI-PUGE-AT-0042]|nr:hypothetical protein BKA70DRAFT_202292 [Coprinopsis sp. MPI-PUGE-AT-0042]